MDPVSHGFIGAGVAALSNQPLAWDNPVYWAAVAGAMAPDLDIVMQARGHIAYLQHHRGISHSIPGLLGFSFLISLGLTAAFPGTPFWSLFIWSFAGALSHGLFDLLNSYGARLLWPFVKRRLTIDSIVLTDPVILGMFFLALLHNRQHTQMAYLAFALSGLYLLLRWLSKLHVIEMVRRELGDEKGQVLVYPAMYRPFSWKFVVDRQDEFVMGSVPFSKDELLVEDVFSKLEHPCIEKAEDSPLGEIFREFTPCYHVACERLEDTQIVTFSDLRYRSSKGFLYTGTAVLDLEGELQEAVFEPYNARRRIKVA